MPLKSVFTLLLVLVVVAAARLYYIGHYAISLPYWDQWDAEGDFLLRAWIEGRLKLRELWQPHNEHRIFPTRVLSLIIFNVTGVWDNLLEARVNVGLAMCIPLIIMLFLIRQNALHGWRWLVALVVVAQFALPFPFENLLVGFQSQFYFLIIFTLLALILATLYPDSRAAMAGMLLLSALSVLTMGSGLLTPLAVAGVYALHGCIRGRIGWWHVAFVAALAAMSVTGYLILPQIASNQIYRAQNLADLSGALGYILSWPLTDNRFAAIVLWAPSVTMVPWLLRERRLTNPDLFMAGCVLWSLTQALAIAYGRGQELTEVASRYTELFSLGLTGNAWFAVRFAEQLGKRPFAWAAGLFFVVLTAAHLLRFTNDMEDIQQSHARSLIQLRNVRHYLETGDSTALDQPQFEIPYPDKKRLQELLDNPTIRGILPEEVTLSRSH